MSDFGRNREAKVGITLGNRTYPSLVASLESPLRQVEALLEDQLSSEDIHVASMLEYVRGLSGKRMRPVLTLLSAEACGDRNAESVRLAAVVELVHTATLIHDDVLDGAEIRRHRPSLHRKWNPKAAILIGDWVFTQAYRLANSGDSVDPGICVAEAAKKICEGELLQDAAIENWELSEKECLEIVAAKTGELSSVACRLGAWSADADRLETQALQRYGMDLGIAFQLQDDWLDYWGDRQALGKPMFGDLRTKKPTIPLVHWLGQLNREERQEWAVILDHMDEASELSVLKAIDQSDSREYTRQLALTFAARAQGHLAVLRDSDAKMRLMELAKLCVFRIL